MDLDFDNGAKDVINKYQSEIIGLDGKKITLDIDTETDYDLVYKLFHK